MREVRQEDREDSHQDKALEGLEGVLYGVPAILISSIERINNRNKKAYRNKSLNGILKKGVAC